MHSQPQLDKNNLERIAMLSKAVTHKLKHNLRGAPVPEWGKPKNREAVAFLNSRFTLEQRLAKFREEALEAALEVTRELDNLEQLAQAGLSGDTLAEIADVVVTLDSLISRTGDNVHLLAAITRAYARLRGRIAAGEFGTPPET